MSTFCPAVSAASRLCDWKMYPICLLTPWSTRGLAPHSSCPRTSRLPSCVERSAPISVSSVVLPEPRQDHDLARADLRRDVEEDLLAEPSGSEVVIDPVHDDRGGAHQKISAGSAFQTTRMALSPERQHMATVAASTPSARAAVMYTGSRVASAAAS